MIEARTPEVDLYDGPNGKRVKTVEQDKSYPIARRSQDARPNMMLRMDLERRAILGAAAHGEVPLRRQSAARMPQSGDGQQRGEGRLDRGSAKAAQTGSEGATP